MTMRIYFSASMSGGRGQAHLYPGIIAALREHGEVLTEFVGDPSVSRMGESALSAEAIYARDIALVDRSDVVVADVTVPSFGVGVEIAHAGHTGKPVLALHQPQEGRRLSAMLAGDPNVTVAAYQSLAEAQKAITDYFTALSQRD